MPIKSFHQFFISGLVAVALIGASALPSHASAFSLFGLFSTNADAAVNADAGGSSAQVLSAATNFDPNPNKGLTDMQATSGNALVAHSGPDGSLADVASSTTPGRISVYVVRPGDTLGEIAKMFNVSVNTIIWANNLSGVKDIHVGDTLIILPISGVKRTVVSGDTLKSIAKKYGADANEIAQFNGLDSSEPLVVGSVIIVPGGEVASAPTTKSSSGKVGREPYLGGGGSIQNGYYSNPLPGMRINQGLHGWNGIDLGGPGVTGTPIHAAADGTVIIAKRSGYNGGYGNYVVITHSNGSQTLYAHMKSVIVSFGQSVSDGQVIGYVGSTGLSTGPHLHFEVRGAANPFRNCTAGTVCAPQ